MALPPGFVPPFLEGETKIESPPWLPAGWHAVERPRDTSAHADRFYYTPDCGVRLRSKPEVERYLAGKPTLESLAKGAPRPPPVPPTCPVEEVTTLARELLARSRAGPAGRAGAQRGAAGAGHAAAGGAGASAGGAGASAAPSADAAGSDAAVAAAMLGPAAAAIAATAAVMAALPGSVAASAAAGAVAAAAAPHFLAAAAASRAPPLLAPAPKARGAKRQMEGELETLGRQLCVRGALLCAARLRRSTHLPLLKSLPTLPLATPLVDVLEPWPVALPRDTAAGAGRDE